MISEHPFHAVISTVLPTSGGVPAKTQWLVKECQSLGIKCTLAWYEPWSCTPAISIPCFELLSGRKPGFIEREVWPGIPGFGIGSWLPELEFTHFVPIGAWQSLIASADIHIATSGNPLCAYRFLSAGVPFLAWVGTSWEGDRRARVQHFPLVRRIVDQQLNSRILKRMERRVLRARQGCILTISKNTAKELKEIANHPTDGVLYMPPESDLFRRESSARVAWRIGFAGRYSDPRKQVYLLLDAVIKLVQKGYPVQLELTGERNGEQVLANALKVRGLQDVVKCHPYLTTSQLANVIQSWDVFVIPSQQEGLCISALEAMACGVPVVSTYCGGPEDFVLPGITGFLVPHEAAALASSIETVCTNPQLRERLSAGCLAWMAENADESAARTRLRNHLYATFPKLRHINA